MGEAAERLDAVRARMVREQIAARGVRDPRVLDAMRDVPREQFLEEGLRDLAYQDTPLPIESDQTISQPYIVAYMTECLQLGRRDRVLEIGTGSGYAAAVIAEIADEVYTVERYENLATSAAERLARFGYDDVHVLHGDGTRGWPEHAPYDAIVVAAGGPEVPRSLLAQLAPGGRLVIPVGATPLEQRLVRVTRIADDHFEEEDLLPVRFVPLIGDEGWASGLDRPSKSRPAPKMEEPRDARTLMTRACEPFEDIDTADLEPLLARIGDARIVLLGEATHGTSEFYRMRTRITRELVERKGFTIVAAEADWPDAALVDRDIRGVDRDARAGAAFTRFPTWMWRNHEVRELIDELREHNRTCSPERRVGFYGLDLYSLFNSIDVVLEYLENVDPEAAALARDRYACLTPWERDPARYGHAALVESIRSCEDEVVHTLRDVLERRLEYAERDGERFFDAAQNARVAAEAEKYYRVMYYGGPHAWNLRDTHMFETLRRVMDFRGDGSRAIVWAHNSHLGDAAATEMGARGEINVGQLCREAFGDDVYAIGFGTDRGTVAAASNWGEPMEIKRVRPSHAKSYEQVCHSTGVDRFLLPMGEDLELRRALLEPRLERAIGVVYRPEMERASHYFMAHLPRQFDEYVWFDETQAVHPLETRVSAGVPETYPFGL
jgi:protein-L-isoaspartate(D-aspartate) O-methyltransferase